MNRNYVLEWIAVGRQAQQREQQLEAALTALMIGLRQQYLDGKPPGEYAYSGNVIDAMHFADSLVPQPDGDPPPPPADAATTRAER